MHEQKNILTEVEKVQNPALGALLLWEYGRRYQNQLSGEPSHLLLYFLILPICLHHITLNEAIGTLEKSGLGKFCEKFNLNREELLAIHERSIKLRSLTLNSIAFGIRAGLFNVEYSSGRLIALEKSPPSPPASVKPLYKVAVKLGAWFQAVDNVSIFKALKVNA